MSEIPSRRVLSPGGPALRQYVEAELLKLRHSRTTRMLWVTMAITPPIIIGLLWWLRGEYSVFPGALRTVGTCLLMLIGLGASLSTGDAIGSEFEQDTAQVAIGRGVPRWAFIAGKGIALLAAALVYALTVWLCGSLASLVSHVSQAGTAGLTMGILALLTAGLDAVGTVVLAAAATIGLVMVIGVLTRSSALATFGGLGLYVGDFYLAGGLGLEFEIPHFNTFSIFHNTSNLLGRLSFSMAPTLPLSAGSSTEPGAAILALVCYAMGGTALAFLLFLRQDLGETA